MSLEPLRSSNVGRFPYVQKTGWPLLESKGEALVTRHCNQKQSQPCKISSRQENQFHNLALYGLGGSKLHIRAFERTKGIHHLMGPKAGDTLRRCRLGILILGHPAMRSALMGRI